MSQYVFAFSVEGLRHPTSTTNANPVLISTGVLPNLSSAVPELASYTVLPLIQPEDISGYNWSSDPRKVIGSGGACQVKFVDGGKLWGKQILRTSKTQRWDLSAPRVESNTVSIIVNGKTAPTANTIYWLEEEAIKSGSVIQQTPTSWYVALATRGACGSRAKAHRIDPHYYYTGDNGKEDRLELDTRPSFANYTFLGSLWLFRLDQFGAVKDYIRRYCYIDEPPRPQKGQKWLWSFKDIGDLLGGYQPGNSVRTITLSKRLQLSAGHVYMYMTRYEAEMLFREPLHTPGNMVLDSNLVSDLSTRMFPSGSNLEYGLDLELSEKWVCSIEAISYIVPTQNTSGYSAVALDPLLKVELRTIKTEIGASPMSDDDGDGIFTYKDGWSDKVGIPIGHQKPGEAAPKVTLRVTIQKPPVEAFLIYCCGNDGSDVSNYNSTIGRIGPGIPISYFNLGTAEANAMDVDPATEELLEQNQLHSSPSTALYQFIFQLSDSRKLGDFLASDVVGIHALAMGPLQNGKLTLKSLAYVRTSTPPTLPTVLSEEVEPGKRLPKLSSLELASGFNELTLAPEFKRSIRTRGVKPRRGNEAESQTYRIWQPGNQLTDQLLQTGAASHLLRVFAEVYSGEPQAFEVLSSLDFLQDNAIEFLDAVTWSNTEILSDTGVGVSGEWWLFGYRFEWRTGKFWARIIEDTFNNNEITSTSNGYRSPVAVPTKVRPLAAGGLTIEIEVDFVGDKSANGTTAHGNSWKNVKDAGGYIKITRPKHHGTTAPQTEAPGWVDAYGQLTDIRYDNGAQRTTLVVSFNAAWERDGNTIVGSLVTPGESYISHADKRPASSNPQNIDIEPPAANLAGGSNLTKVAGPQAFDRSRHLFGS